MSRKIYFRIGEVAKKFGVQPSLIRYWEKEFAFIKPRKSPKGTRLFTQKDIDNFAIVYHLIKEKGMTIQGTREYFKKHYDKESLDTLQVINTLKKTKSLLQDIQMILKNQME
jgi:DNA-binding transcriptional MerR regulator